MTNCRTRVTIAVVLALTVAAVCLRVPKLTSRALWFDEVFQVDSGSAPDLRGVAERVAAGERSPPLGFVFSWVGLAVSDDELGARLPSLLFGVACVPLGWAAGRLWGDRATGFWVAAFAAAAPAYVFYSREARVYTTGVAAVFALLAAGGWFRVRPGARSGAALAGAAVFAVSVQYAGAVVAAVWLLAMWLAAPPAGPDRRTFRRGWLLTAGLSAFAVAVWVCAFLVPQVRLRGTGTGDADFKEYFWDPAEAGSAVRFATGAVPGFFEYPFLGGETGPRWAALALLAALPGALAALAALRKGSDPRGRVVAAFAAGSVLAFVALAGLGKHPFGGTRHCLPLTPGCLLLVGLGLARVGRVSRPLAIGWGALGLALMGYGTVHTGWHKHEHGVKPLAAAVAARAAAGDPVVVYGGAVNTCKYYEPRLPWPGPVFYCGWYLTNPPEHEFGPTVAELLRRHGRVWVVEFHPFDADLVPPGVPAERAAVLNEARARATLWVSPPRWRE